MEACPKCNFSLAPGAQECPACGIVLAKFKAPAPRVAPPHTPATPPPIPQAVAAPMIPAQPLVHNPYVPPLANVEGFAPQPPMMAPAAPAGEITPATLAALDSARPWLRFVVGYGFVSVVILAISAFSMLVLASRNLELLPLSLIYFLAAGFSYAALLPLKRSSEAIGRLPWMGASAGLESFVVEQSQFWRRTGLLTAAALVLVVLGVLVAVAIGVNASSGQETWSSGPGPSRWEPTAPH
jgi:hypothetical protein